MFFIQVTGALISEVEKEESSWIEIKFEKKVMITRSFYPSVDYPNLLTNIGGALGLWLGVGVIQLLSYGMNLISFMNLCFRKESHWD